MNGSEVDFGPLRAPEQFMVLGLTQPQPGGRSYSPAKQKTLTPRTHVSAGCGEKAISQTLRTSPVGPGLGGRRGPRCPPGCHLDGVCRDVGGQPLKATAWPGVGGSSRQLLWRLGCDSRGRKEAGGQMEGVPNRKRRNAGEPL